MMGSDVEQSSSQSSQNNQESIAAGAEQVLHQTTPPAAPNEITGGGYLTPLVEGPGETTTSSDVQERTCGVNVRNKSSEPHQSVDHIGLPKPKYEATSQASNGNTEQLLTLPGAGVVPRDEATCFAMPMAEPINRLYDVTSDVMLKGLCNEAVSTSVCASCSTPAKISHFSEVVSLLKFKYQEGLSLPDVRPRKADDISNTLIITISHLMSAVLDDIQGTGSRQSSGGQCPGHTPALGETERQSSCTSLHHVEHLDPAAYGKLQHTLIDDLPDEVLHHLFFMFQLQERCRLLAQVCRRWHGLVMDPIHWRQLRVGHLRSELLCRCLQQATLLKKLDLGSRRNITLAEATLFAQNCPQLQELDLSFCDTVTNALLAVIAEKCTSLQRINLEGCSKVNDDSLVLLSGMPKLSRINLSHCNAVQTEGVEALARNILHMTELNIDGIPGVLDRAILVLEKHHGSHMEQLSVDGAELTDLSAVTFTSFSVLTTLKVSFAELFTDVALSHVKSMKGLQCLMLRKGNDFSSDALQDMFDSGCLQGLQSLDLSECVQILDSGIGALVKCCGKTLRQLALSWCWNITEVGLEAIIQGCPGMETLELVGLDKITGNCLVEAPVVMPRLRYLDLQQCNQVIDDQVVEVVRQLPHLIAYNYYGERFHNVRNDVVMIQ